MRIPGREPDAVESAIPEGIGVEDLGVIADPVR